MRSRAPETDVLRVPRNAESPQRLRRCPAADFLGGGGGGGIEPVLRDREVLVSTSPTRGCDDRVAKKSSENCGHQLRPERLGIGKREQRIYTRGLPANKKKVLTSRLHHIRESGVRSGSCPASTIDSGPWIKSASPDMPPRRIGLTGALSRGTGSHEWVRGRRQS